MILRNKKTGEVGEAYWSTFRENGTDLCISLHKNGAYVEVRSLAELNEEWEDYKPKEPLIEYEKARKVFQEWVKLYDAERFRATHLFDSKMYMTVLRSTDLTTEPSIDLPGHIGKDSEIYTIDELCGEDEE